MVSDPGFDILHSSLNNFYDEPTHSIQGRQAWLSASRAAKYMTKTSKIVNPEMEKAIPRFEECEIEVGKLLGSGGFNRCHELQRINLIKNPIEDAPNARKICSVLQKEQRAFVARNTYRKSSSTRRYAIKFLSAETIENPDRFQTGATDLVIEAKFLASLNHPNIIKLRGMSADGTKGFASCRERGYFILIDRLQCTLENKLEEWAEYEDRLTNTQFSPRIMATKKGYLAGRIQVALDVASALQYLHKKNIIYRDLKPDNIGFDHRGDVKLFDFGLAKELDDSLKSGFCDEYYELSGNTGSLRYMAPEVACGDPYNLQADVYSFGLLLWQICALQLPYDGMTRTYHSDLVIRGGERPPLFQRWSTSLRILIKRSWDSQPMIRPSMASACKILKREIDLLHNSNDLGLGTTAKRQPTTSVIDSESRTRREDPRRTSKQTKGEIIGSSTRRRLLNKQQQSTSRGMKSKHFQQPKSSRAAISNLLEPTRSQRNAVAA